MEEKKILIIDDNQSDRYLMKNILKHVSTDLRFFEASSGEEGIASLAEINPDIIVLDLNLPQMNGFQVCRKIKDDVSRNVKVILVTGETDAMNAFKIRDADADDYCAKTSDFEELKEIIKKMI